MRGDATAFRVGEFSGPLTQGSDAKRRSVATLGWRAQSLWNRREKGAAAGISHFRFEISEGERGRRQKSEIRGRRQRQRAEAGGRGRGHAG